MQPRTQAITRAATLIRPGLNSSRLWEDLVPSVAVAETVNWRGQALLIRPIVPGDEIQHSEFFAHLDAEDLRLRFFSQRREMPRAEMQRLVNPNSANEVGFIALLMGVNGLLEEVATASATADRDNIEAEFGIIVRSDLKRQGLGRLLLSRLIACVRRRGTERIVCDVLRENAAMRSLAVRLGFRIEPRTPSNGPMRYVLALRPARAAAIQMQRSALAAIVF